MKNLIIIGGMGFAVYFVLNKFNGASASPAYTSGGLKTTDTKGREIEFMQNKNGYLQDQYGRVWA